MPRIKTLTVTVGCSVLTVLLLAGCGSSSGPTGTTSLPKPNGEAVQVASSGVGTHLDDSAGRALYVFAADTPGHSTCTGSCLTYWPIEPAPVTTPTSLAGVTAMLGVLTRPDGTKQMTIDGLPVYTYSGDSTPGMTSGQGLNVSGGLWWLVTPSGHALTSIPTATATATATASSAGRTY
jgi:predicted lipoprotein with Yx(FWY)xxD motif